MSEQTDRLEAEALEKLENVAQGIAQLIGPAFDESGALFAVLGFTAGPGGWSTWISNANRADVIISLREIADILEVEGDQAPQHGMGPGPGHSGGGEA